MTSLSTARAPGQSDFAVIADSFLHAPGLPFASVLDRESIARVFREEKGLFGQEDIFSTQMVLWAFLAQVLRDGKGAACAAAVADIATYMQQTGGAVPSGDTGDYCRARAKLDRSTMRRLARRAGRQLDERVPAEWLWHGLRARLVDGFTFTMMDTPENQRAYPKRTSPNCTAIGGTRNWIFGTSSRPSVWTMCAARRRRWLSGNCGRHCWRTT